MRMKKIIYRLRLFFSRFKKQRHYEESEFIYEREDE
jgi:hypothetical protein